VLDGFYRGISREIHDELVRESTLCDVFLTSRARMNKGEGRDF